nr:ImcF-related family protein [Pseudomonas sp. Leaf127]
MPPPDRFAAIKAHLREYYGPFWTRKVRLLWVVGDEQQVAALVPGLVQQQWLEANGTLMVWAGPAGSEALEPIPQALLKLRRRRPLDAMVWALPATQIGDLQAMNAGTRHLQGLMRTLRWQAPLYLWQVGDSAWAQAGRPVEPVGFMLPEQAAWADLEAALQGLLVPLRVQGLNQMHTQMEHDFLLRLSRDLQAEGLVRWPQTLAPLFGAFARALPLRGVWFSLPHAVEHSTLQPHGLYLDQAWAGVLSDSRARGQHTGWAAPRMARLALLSLAALCTAGLLLSYTTNRAQIAQVHTALAAVEHPGTDDEHLLALNELMCELGRLDARARNGVPWYQRLGLSQNAALLEALWPRYVEANNRLLRDPAAARLQRELQAFAALPADSPERARQAPQAYEHLKAQLMMARPDKADPVFLARVLGQQPPPDGVAEGLWRALAPGLLGFYAEQLAAHPQWGIEVDARQVAQVRRVLLGQLGQRNAQASLYRQVLDAADTQYPPLGLDELVGDTEARSLFTTRAEVPGVFTRQAWDGQVREAIESIARARREQIDWVLSDRPGDIAAELSPEALAAQLTRRYFEDYSDAWLGMLNSLRWQPAGSLAEVIDQLTLMSDVRQSPLIALGNTLAWQAQAGTRAPALGDALLQSAQQLIGQDTAALIEPSVPGFATPLEATFGPWLALLGKEAEGQAGNDRLTLQAFLTRVTRVRLKLQQISHAPDPQGMTRALAQTVFQGNGIDLTDTQAYGSLIAASLGGQWAGAGQALFVQPLEQAWQQVLQPSAAGLNRQWQRAIVSDWDNSFNGRYPFAATGSDASLAQLGQMIRADSGRIEQFLQRELGGVLRKEGSRWVVDPTHGQGLRFNPAFLKAINQLSHLSDVLYTDGGLGLNFELQGKATRHVVQTTFTLNGTPHEYFNQRETGQRFIWPGRSDHPGVSVRWIGAVSGERLLADHQGSWGLIRLLEQAQVTTLDDSASRYQLILKAPDGLGLTWHLRTELGEGPLTLLKLRGFKLPRQVFLATAGADL